MTKVVLHIGRLVLHGADPFSAEAFTENLRREIEQRIADGAGRDIGQRLQGNAPSGLRGTSLEPRKHPQPAGRTSAEGAVAAEVVGRLFK